MCTFKKNPCLRSRLGSPKVRKKMGDRPGVSRGTNQGRRFLRRDEGKVNVRQ